MLTVDNDESEDMKTYDIMIQHNYNNLKRMNPINLIKYTFDPLKIGQAFGTSNVDAVVGNLQDGRSCSFWLELVVIECYGMIGNSNKNDLFDAIIETKENNILNNLNVGIKSLTKNGLDLMQSGFKGRGIKNISKEAKNEALLSSIILCDYHIITDIIDAPTIYFIPLTSKELIFKFMNPKCPLVLKRDAFYQTFFGKSLEQLNENKEFHIWKP